MCRSAHFAGLQGERVIIVCDRYSAYKKLARLADAILLAFCWAHVRRDFLDAGRSYKALEPWALDWKARIGETLPSQPLASRALGQRAPARPAKRDL